MRQQLRRLAIAAVLALCPAVTMIASADRVDRDDEHRGKAENVQLGPRPFYLVNQMQAGQLKNTLQACIANIKRYKHHDFSIGHRGTARQFPEHTKESYEAGRRMGAGILECDVTFTPAVFNGNVLVTSTTALCCTTDITLAEFKSLTGKMDASNPRATTVTEFLGGTPHFRTDLYSHRCRLTQPTRWHLAQP